MEPENLQMIKTEHNIKERLNLHVKSKLKRLQQQPEQMTTLNSVVATPPPPNAAETTNRGKDKQKEPQKTRRPYQKRTDKANTVAAAAETLNDASRLENASSTAVGRKYKRHKTKAAATGSAASLPTAAVVAEIGCVSDESVAASVFAGSFASGNGEDDGEDASETKMGGAGGVGNKEKCPDVLGVLLNLKKRALMQDPEVRDFLNEVMNVIKS